MKIKIYNDLNEICSNVRFKELIEEYEDDNQYSFTSIFGYKGFLNAYVKAFNLKSSDLYLLSIENNNKIILFIPFQRKRFLFFNIYNSIGGNKIDYSICLYNRDFKNNYFFILGLLKKHFSNNSIIKLNSMVDPFIINVFLKNFSYNVSFIRDKCSYVELDSYQKRISNKLIKEISRLEKKINKIGKLTMFNDKNENTINQIMDFLIKNKNQQYLNSGVSILDKNSEEFYRKLTRENISDVSALYLDDNIIAAHLGLVTRKNYTYLLPVYDYKFRSYSPGWILMFKLLRRNHDKKLLNFDLTIGNEGYKSRLNPVVNDIFFIGCTNNIFSQIILKLEVFLLIFKIKFHKIKTSLIHK